MAYLGLLQNTPLSSEEAIRVIQGSTRVPVLQYIQIPKIEVLEGGQKPKGLRINVILLSFAMIALGACLQFVEAVASVGTQCSRQKETMTNEDFNAFMSIFADEQKSLTSALEEFQNNPIKKDEAKVIQEKIGINQSRIDAFVKNYQGGSFIVPSYTCFRPGCTPENSQVHIELQYTVLEGKVIRPYKNIMYSCPEAPVPLPALPQDLSNIRDQILGAMPDTIDCIQKMNEMQAGYSEKQVSAYRLLDPNFPRSLVTPRITVETFYRQMQGIDEDLANTWMQCLLLEPKTFSSESSYTNVNLIPRVSYWDGNAQSSRCPSALISDEFLVDADGSQNIRSLALTYSSGDYRLSPYETTPKMMFYKNLPPGRVRYQPDQPYYMSQYSSSGQISILDRNSFVGSFVDEYDVVSYSPGYSTEDSEKYIRDHYFDGVEPSDSQVVVQAKVRQNIRNSVVNLALKNLPGFSTKVIEQVANSTILSAEDTLEQLRQGRLREQKYTYTSSTVGTAIDALEASLFLYDQQLFLSFIYGSLSLYNALFAWYNTSENVSFQYSLLLNILGTKALQIHNILFYTYLLWRSVSYKSLPKFQNYFRIPFRALASLSTMGTQKTVGRCSIDPSRFYGPNALSLLAVDQTLKSWQDRIVDAKCYLSDQGLSENYSMSKVSIYDIKFTRMTSFYNLRRLSTIGAILGFFVDPDIIKDRTLFLNLFYKQMVDLLQSSRTIEDLLQVTFDESVLTNANTKSNLSDSYLPNITATEQYLAIVSQSVIDVSKGSISDTNLKEWKIRDLKTSLAKNEEFIAQFRSYNVESLDVPNSQFKIIETQFENANKKLQQSRQLSNQVLAIKFDDLTKMNVNVLLKNREEILNIFQKLMSSMILLKRITQSLRIYVNDIQEYNMKMENLLLEAGNQIIDTSEIRKKEIYDAFFVTRKYYEEKKQYAETLYSIAMKLPTYSKDFETQIVAWDSIAYEKEIYIQREIDTAARFAEELRLQAQARQAQSAQALAQATQMMQARPGAFSSLYAPVSDSTRMSVEQILNAQSLAQQIQGPIRADQFGQSIRNAQQQSIARTQQVSQTLTSSPGITNRISNYLMPTPSIQQQLAAMEDDY